MRHRVVGQTSPGTTKAQRIGGLAVVLSLVAAAGLATALGVSSAATPFPRNLVANPGLESSLSGWAATSSGTKLDRVASGFQSTWAGRIRPTTSGAAIAQVAISGVVPRTTSLSVFAMGVWVRLSPGQSVTFQAREVLGSAVVSSSKTVQAVKAGWRFIALPYGTKRAGSRLDVTITVPRPTASAPVLFDGLYVGQVRGAAVAPPGASSGTTAATRTAGIPPINTASTISGWPGPSNTGVPAGTVLHPCPTTITVTGTYDSCQFNGSVTVKANNVVISRSLVVGRVLAGSGSQQTGLLIKDTTIDARGFGSNSTGTPPGVSYANFTLLRVNLFGSGHGVQTNGNAVIKDSWIHDLCCDNVAHKDGIISNGGSNVTVVHNNVECAAGNYCSAALGLFGDFSPISHWTVQDNLFNTTGGYCAYGGDSTAKKFPVSTYIVFQNNHFGNQYNPRCGTYGPIGGWTTNTGDIWTGNVDATGEGIHP